MNIEEFQLRYMGYEWLNNKFQLWFNENTLVKLAERTDNWKITKQLTEVSPDELKKATLKTYTNFKKKFIKENWQKKIKNNFTLWNYIDRLEYELKVIHEMWYETYFLIVQDYIMYWKKNWIVVWPWRWSAAWSLLSYLIRITEIDPMEYDLLFERFLNPARISMPDIDTDFEDSERDKILEYCKTKYWIWKVSNIWTYMTMAAKASFKDVARVFWLSFTKANQLSWYIEKSIEKSYETNEEFKKIIDESDNLKDIIKYASKLEWNVRQLWVHACWVIIAPEDVTNYSPIQYPLKSASKEPDTTRVVTQYDWHYLEDIWLLKMDFLWLRNLSIIKNTIKIIRAKLKWDFSKLNENKKENEVEDTSIYEKFFDYHVFEPPMDDDTTYKIFQDWDTVWVFQFESDWMRSWLKKLKPTCIDDIIAMVSLYRPWPMEWIPNYIDRKQWKEKISYLPNDIYNDLVKKYWKDIAEQQKSQITKDLSPFMDVTYWIPVYQEQLMRIVQAMAWFSLGEADLLRRWVWKKIKEVIEKLKKEFIDKSLKSKWYKEEVARFVYEKMIEPAANYSFNKSHAACYAVIAYQTAYLKAHHPIEFYAALLRSVEENTERFAELLDELKIKWIKIKPANINKSFNHVAAEEDAIVIWFLSIKWIWFDVWENIENERTKNWEYKNLEDFIKRNEKYINKKTLESLIKSWSLDVFEDRLILLNNVENILDRLKTSQTKNNNSWMGLFDDELLWVTPLILKKWNKSTQMDRLKLEYETFWTFISSHPLDWLYSYIKAKFNFLSQVLDSKYEWEFKLFWFIKNTVKSSKFWWFFVEFEDITWTNRFFIKNISWLSNFDIVIVEWKKQKRLSISKIIKINLENLIKILKNKWKFKEDEAVAVIRKKRWNDINKKEFDDTNKKNSDVTIKQDNFKNTSNNTDYKNDNINKKVVYYEVELDLPEDIEKLKKLALQKKKNPTKKEFEIDWKVYLL